MTTAKPLKQEIIRKGVLVAQKGLSRPKHYRTRRTVKKAQSPQKGYESPQTPVSVKCPRTCQYVNPALCTDARGTVKNASMGRLRHARRTVDGQSINRACRAKSYIFSTFPYRTLTRARPPQNDQKTRGTLEGRSNCAEHDEKTRRTLGGRSKCENVRKHRGRSRDDQGMQKDVEKVRRSR